MIQFAQVTKSYPSGDVVLDNISFDITPGEFILVTGKSGAGKTTLGRLLIRDLVPTSGTITIDGEDLSKIKSSLIPILRRKIGFIFQDYKIIPDKTIAENIAIALEIAGYKQKEIPDRITHLLEIVAIPHKAHLFPSQLSGGEVQRASIARAIAAEPPILFADEPTGNLDRDTSVGIFELLRKINQSGTTIIMATHDITLIQLHPDRHIHLENGKIVKDIKTKEISKTKKIKKKKKKIVTKNAESL